VVKLTPATPGLAAFRRPSGLPPAVRRGRCRPPGVCRRPGGPTGWPRRLLGASSGGPAAPRQPPGRCFGGWADDAPAVRS